MNHSKIIHDNKCIDYIKSFKLRRKVSIYINNNLKTPVTYGLLKPKIILQSYILEDEELLKYVMMHELTHIKRFHILFNHIVNLVACVFWCNPLLIISLKYLEQDIEIYTDKEVISRLGDTIETRKDYCRSMFQLMRSTVKRDEVSLKLNPNLERMIIMKNYKKTILGTFIFALTFLFSIPVFASVVKLEKDRIEVIGTEVEFQSVDNSEGRIHIISEEEYNKLNLKDIYAPQLRFIDMSEIKTINEYDKLTYKFDTSLWTGSKNDGFIIKLLDLKSSSKLLDLKSSSKIEYLLIVVEDGDEIYENKFSSDKILKVKANPGSKYMIYIFNFNNRKLTGDININAYKQ